MTLTDAEQRFLARQPLGHLAAEIIRLHPLRVIACNVDPDHRGLQTRAVAAGTQPNAA